MRYVMVACVALVTLFATGPGHAQAGPAAAGMAISEVLAGLESAIRALNTTLETAGGEVRSTGASLTANAQNLVVNINQQLGRRLQQTVGDLKGAERQLVDDALLVMRQMQQATKEITANAGEQARRTLQEADITAYNASYSLPCRSLVPRVVYVTPEFIRRGGGVPEVKIHGNFFDIGAPPKVTVGGKPAKVLARGRNEMTVAIPQEVVTAVGDPGSVSVAFRPEMAERTNLGAMCWDRNRPMDANLSAAVELRPELTYALAGTIRGVYSKYTPWSNTFDYYRSDNDCAASFDDHRQYCVPEEYTLNPDKMPEFVVTTKNCNSSASTPTIADDRCVNVAGHIGGCGYDNFLVVRNCKGRGWLGYKVILHGRKAEQANMPDTVFKLESKDGTQRSFQATHDDAAKNYPNAVYTYAININVMEGSKVTRVISAGSGNPNPEGANTRLDKGTVYINIQ